MSVTVDGETVEQIEVALRHVCPHERCVGRDALLDAAKRLIPGTADWIVKSDGGMVELYALSEGSLHRLTSPCVPSENGGDADIATCEYRVVARLTGNETFTCEVERAQDGEGADETRTTWTFALDIPVIEYDASAHAGHSERFALALVEAILAAPIAV